MRLTLSNVTLPASNKLNELPYFTLKKFNGTISVFQRLCEAIYFGEEVELFDEYGAPIPVGAPFYQIIVNVSISCENNTFFSLDNLALPAIRSLFPNRLHKVSRHLSEMFRCALQRPVKLSFFRGKLISLSSGMTQVSFTASSLYRLFHVPSEFIDEVTIPYDNACTIADAIASRGGEIYNPSSLRLAVARKYFKYQGFAFSGETWWMYMNQYLTSTLANRTRVAKSKHFDSVLVNMLRDTKVDLRYLNLDSTELVNTSKYSYKISGNVEWPNYEGVTLNETMPVEWDTRFYKLTLTTKQLLDFRNADFSSKLYNDVGILSDFKEENRKFELHKFGDLAVAFPSNKLIESKIKTQKVRITNSIQQYLLSICLSVIFSKDLILSKEYQDRFFSFCYGLYTSDTDYKYDVTIDLEKCVSTFSENKTALFSLVESAINSFVDKVDTSKITLSPSGHGSPITNYIYKPFTKSYRYGAEVDKNFHAVLNWLTKLDMYGRSVFYKSSAYQGNVCGLLYGHSSIDIKTLAFDSNYFGSIFYNSNRNIYHETVTQFLLNNVIGGVTNIKNSYLDGVELNHKLSLHEIFTISPTSLQLIQTGAKCSKIKDLSAWWSTAYLFLKDIVEETNYEEYQKVYVGLLLDLTTFIMDKLALEETFDY